MPDTCPTFQPRKPARLRPRAALPAAPAPPPAPAAVIAATATGFGGTLQPDWCATELQEPAEGVMG